MEKEEEIDNDPTGEIRYLKQKLFHIKQNTRDLSVMNIFLFVVIIILVGCLTISSK